MLHNSRPYVLCSTYINPKGTKETVDPGAVGRVPQDRFALKQELTVTILREGHGRSRVFIALAFYSTVGEQDGATHWTTLCKRKRVRGITGTGEGRGCRQPKRFGFSGQRLD